MRGRGWLCGVVCVCVVLCEHSLSWGLEPFPLAEPLQARHLRSAHVPLYANMSAKQNTRPHERRWLLEGYMGMMSHRQTATASQSVSSSKDEAAKEPALVHNPPVGPGTQEVALPNGYMARTSPANDLDYIFDLREIVRKTEGPLAWLGADVASSIKLTDDRYLWVFGDTFVGTFQMEETRRCDITYLPSQTFGFAEMDVVSGVVKDLTLHWASCPSHDPAFDPSHAPASPIITGRPPKHKGDDGRVQSLFLYSASKEGEWTSVVCNASDPNQRPDFLWPLSGLRWPVEPRPMHIPTTPTSSSNIEVGSGETASAGTTASATASATGALPSPLHKDSAPFGTHRHFAYAEQSIGEVGEVRHREPLLSNEGPDKSIKTTSLSTHTAQTQDLEHDKGKATAGHRPHAGQGQDNKDKDKDGEPLLLLAVHSTNKSKGGRFIVLGSVAILVANPEDRPQDWRYRVVEFSRQDMKQGGASAAPVWGASPVVCDDGYSYIWGSLRNVNHLNDQVLSRVPTASLRRVDFSGMEAWGRALLPLDSDVAALEKTQGPMSITPTASTANTSLVSGNASDVSKPLAPSEPAWFGINAGGWAWEALAKDEGVSELSIIFHDTLKLWIKVTLPVFTPTILLWTSVSLTGPWKRHVLYNVPFPYNDLDRYKFYAAKIHPELSPSHRRGSELIVSYVIGMGPRAIPGDFYLPGPPWLYNPQFLRVSLDKLADHGQ